MSEEVEITPTTQEIPSDLFDIIVGHNDVKEIL